MPDGDGIISSNAAGKWVGDSRERDHEDTEQSRAKGDDDPGRVPGRCEHHREKCGHKKDVVTGEEYVAHGSEAGEEQRDHKAKDHDPGDLAAELVLCNAYDCLIGWHHALRASSARNHGAEWLERIGD